MSDQIETVVIGRPEELFRVSTRRSFLKLLGVGGTIVVLPGVFAACSDKTSTGPNGTSGPVSLNLSNDTGILNYAYALEQLEAAFYLAVVANSTVFNGLPAAEQELLSDLRNHEVAHREFLKRVLGSNAIGTLALNSATVGTAVSSRANILMYAEVFEDLGVSAYNGAGKYLTSADNLTVAGKIVSVEARHAAAIRDTRDTGNGTRFSSTDVIDQSGTYSGLDVKLDPSAVLAAVQGSTFVTTAISIGTQPPTRAGTPDRAPTHT